MEKDQFDLLITAIVTAGVMSGNNRSPSDTPKQFKDVQMCLAKAGIISPAAADAVQKPDDQNGM